MDNKAMIKAVASLVAVCVLLYLGLSLVSYYQKRSGERSQLVAAHDDGAAQAAKQAALKFAADQQALQAQKQEAVDAAEKAKAELAQLKLHPKTVVKFVTVPQVQANPEEALKEIEQLRAENDKKDEIIADDVKVKAALEAQLSTSMAESAQWKRAFENEEKSRIAQENATISWRHAATTSRWRGRLEGAAATLALGFIAKR